MRHETMEQLSLVPVHTCHAQGCRAPVPPRMLMCLRHWRMLPAGLRHQVWRTYRSGQELDKKPTKKYLLAARAAVEWLAKKEGRRG